MTHVKRGGGRWRQRFARSDGFTLVELFVVLSILSVSLLYVVPRIVEREKSELKGAARRLLYTVRRFSDEALFKKEKRVLNIDLDKGEYWGEDGRSRRSFPGDVFVKRMVIGTEEVSKGVVSIIFFPSGLRDEASITLSSRGTAAYTVVIPALGERFDVREE